MLEGSIRVKVLTDNLIERHFSSLASLGRLETLIGHLNILEHVY
jgi:hypothetical protein